MVIKGGIKDGDVYNEKEDDILYKGGKMLNKKNFEKDEEFYKFGKEGKEKMIKKKKIKKKRKKFEDEFKKIL